MIIAALCESSHIFPYGTGFFPPGPPFDASAPKNLIIYFTIRKLFENFSGSDVASPLFQGRLAPSFRPRSVRENILPAEFVAQFVAGHLLFRRNASGYYVALSTIHDISERSVGQSKG